MKTIDTIISILDLQAHPEGGYFKETYRSKGIIKTSSLDNSFSGERNYCTSIYFLLTSDSFSAFHKINQDEIWHFYDGSPILLHTISPDGDYNTITIGKDIYNNETLQYVVPGGWWFAAEVIELNSYSLLGCTVAPGFHFDDFVLESEAVLAAMFPKHKAIIARLTHH